MLHFFVVSLFLNIALGEELKYAQTFEKRAKVIAKAVNDLGAGWSVCFKVYNFVVSTA